MFPASAPASTLRSFIPLRPTHVIRRYRRNLTNVGARYSSKVLSNPTIPPPPPAENPRWLSDIKARLGACIGFGLQGEAEVRHAGRVAAILAREWRGLVAGAEGFYIEDVPEDGREDTGGGYAAESAESRLKNAWIEGVRWGDMDSMGTWEFSHVNNTLYLRYAEISRIHYCRKLSRHCPQQHRREWSELWTPRGIGLIYKRCEVDFLLPVTFPDRLTLCHRLDVTKMPPAGEPLRVLPLRVCLLSHAHQRNAARVYEENVIYDYRQGKRSELQGWMEEVVRKVREEEEDCKARWMGRRAVVEGMVEDLEAKTVKSGRAEDMGKMSRRQRGEGLHTP